MTELWLKGLNYVVQKGKKRKMQVLESQTLAFCWVPGAAVEIINLTKIILN